MKNSILALCFVFIGSIAFAQDYKLPSKSPRQLIIQQFSLSMISVDYGRPSVRKRSVFGELVPYGKIWRLGANEATTIDFRQDVLFAEKKVAAGDYSLYAIPNQESWTLILNSDTENWGAYGYKEENDVLRVELPVQKSENNMENLTFSFENVTEDATHLHIAWDDTHVAVPIKISNRNEVREFISSAAKKKEK